MRCFHCSTVRPVCMLVLAGAKVCCFTENWPSSAASSMAVVQLGREPTSREGSMLSWVSCVHNAVWYRARRVRAGPAWPGEPSCPGGLGWC